MRLIEKVTLEAREDRLWRPYIFETFCWNDLEMDTEYWAFFLLAPFVWLWCHLNATDWSKRNATSHEMRLRGTPSVLYAPFSFLVPGIKRLAHDENMTEPQRNALLYVADCLNQNRII